MRQLRPSERPHAVWGLGRSTRGPRPMTVRCGDFAWSGSSEDPVIAAPADFGFAGSLRRPSLLEELRAALTRALGMG